MAIDLSALSAGPLVAVLTRAATSAQVTITATLGGMAQWNGPVARASQNGTALIVRVYVPGVTAPFAINGIFVEYGNLSLNAGIGTTDFAFVSAAPAAPGFFIDFTFALAASQSSVPVSTGPGVTLDARLTALEQAMGALAGSTALAAEVAARTQDDLNLAAQIQAETGMRQASENILLLQATNAGASSAVATVTAQIGQDNGIAGLDATGKVLASQLPSYVDGVVEGTLATFPIPGLTGKIYTDTATGLIYRWSGTIYINISASPGSTDAVPEGNGNLYFTPQRAANVAPVQSVAGRTGNVILTANDVGLGGVNNTPDSAKPVSAPQAAALALCAPLVRNHITVPASRALAASDHNAVLECTAGMSLSNPGNLPAGFECDVVQLGAAQVLFAGVQNRFNLTSTGGQYARVSLALMSTGVLILSGELA